MAPNRRAHARRAQNGLASKAVAHAALPPRRLSDSVFFSFIDFIASVADGNGRRRPSPPLDVDSDADGPPPAKRARTETPPAESDDATGASHADDYVPLSRCALTFRRRLSSAAAAARRPRVRPVDRLPANTLYSLRSRKQEGLALSAQRGQPSAVPAAVRTVVFPPDEVGGLGDEEALILEVAEQSSRRPARPGHFWTAVFLSVDERPDTDTDTDTDIDTDGDAGGSVVLTIELELRWMTSAYVAATVHSHAEGALRARVLSTLFPHVARGLEPAAPGRRAGKGAAPDVRSPQDFYEAAHVTRKDGDDDLYVPGLTASLFPFQRRAVKWLLQREGVRWAPEEAEAAARRQACEADADEPSVVVPYQPPSEPETTAHFAAATDADGAPFYVSELFGVATRDRSIFEAHETAFRGGILSEEMGLGKTVEMIALILLNPRPPTPPWPPGPAGGSELRPTGATLIVAPPALKNQWISEFQRHAPHLSVMVYAGMARSCASAADEAALVDQLAAHDVVVTTYSDLTSELHFAVAPPERNLRSSRDGRGGGGGADGPRYRPRSPLVQLSWWRVCLDEAQEIESGVRNAATVVRVIPRVNAWGVTGTPVKDGVQDLYGLLLFLRYEPYASIPKVWQQLTQRHKRVFRHLFGRLALRHSKRAVGGELTIPPQKRYVITMPFTAVEEQHYRSLFKRLAEACGLDTQGAPLADDWDPHDGGVLEAMRTALSRLRQTALHPEIGGQHRRALGHRGGHAGPIRTVAEVLEAMIEQSESALLVDRRALLAHKLKRGQLLENSPRAKEALALWKEVLADSEVLVAEARAKLKAETERAAAAAAVAGGEGQPGKAVKGEEGVGDDDDDDDEDEEGDNERAGGRVGEAQRELRHALELLHKAEFFCANGYFQIKSNEAWTVPGSDDFRRLEALEVEGYERAKRVRREILHENRSKALRLMAELADRAAAQAFVEIPECAFAPPEGLEGRRLGDELDRLAVVLSRQAAQMDEWREAVVQLLLKELVDEDGEEGSPGGQDADAADAKGKDVADAGNDADANAGADAANGITGDEYEDSTKVQDEIQAYITILKAGISDRNALLTGVAPSGLAVYDERLALRMAKDGEGPAPELMLRLFAERRAALAGEGPGGGGGGSGSNNGSDGNDGNNGNDSNDDNHDHDHDHDHDNNDNDNNNGHGHVQTGGADVRSLRAVVVDLRELSQRLGGGGGGSSQPRAQLERACVGRQLAAAQAEQTRQLKVCTELEKETNRMRNALNKRIAYYRQLQVVSDMVALYEGPKDAETVAAMERGEAALAHALATAESAHRYLLHLKETDTKEEARLCVICQSTFSIGVLTVCGHQFCKECISLWFKAHHNCPMCKRTLGAANLHDISLKPQELKVVDERGAASSGGSRPDAAQPQLPGGAGAAAGADAAEAGGASGLGADAAQIYTAFSAAKLAEIQNIELPGPSFTTKVDTMVRHVLWLRASDPGAKCVVFSQYPAFLGILAEAFRQHHIGFSRYADRDGIARFQDDPAVECFLLHARAHASGLNLVHASHVLLCEPLLHTALELQAIARVHRIGQEHETTVWLYVVDGTVETSIYELSVRRRLAHMAADRGGVEEEGEGEAQARAQAEDPAAGRDDSLELANTRAMQQAQLSKLMGKGKMAGEEVAQDDLWTCLFGHVTREAAGAADAAARAERLRSDPAVRRYLAAAAAEAREGGPAAAAAM